MDISLESKALSILETYEGGNNFILELKRKSQINKKFYPTRSQAEYIITNHENQPKVARKWIILDTYFAKKLADDKLYTEIPEKIWVEKLLAEKEKAYHIWGKVFEKGIYLDSYGNENSGCYNFYDWFCKDYALKAKQINYSNK